MDLVDTPMKPDTTDEGANFAYASGLRPNIATAELACFIADFAALGWRWESSRQDDVANMLRRSLPR